MNEMIMFCALVTIQPLACLDKIFTEIAALFPYPYIHIGGDEAYKGFWDECPKCQKRMADEHLKNVDELQSYFVKRVEKIVESKGKKLIGWDEILEGGLAPNATVMSWRGMSGGIAAAKMGHKVVMTPWDYCYLDLYQGEPAGNRQLMVYAVFLIHTIMNPYRIAWTKNIFWADKEISGQNLFQLSGMQNT